MRSVAGTTLALAAFVVAASASIAGPSVTDPPAPQPIPGQLPQIGNGFVATFANATTEYLGGLFNGARTHSTRAGLPATTHLFPACALASNGGVLGDAYPFAMDYRAAMMSINGSCPTASFKQTWLAPREQRHLLLTFIEAAGSGAFHVVEAAQPAADYAQLITVQAPTPVAPMRTAAVFQTFAPEVEGSMNHTVAVVRYSSVEGAVDATTGATVYVVALPAHGAKKRVFTRISATVSTLEYPGMSPLELVAKANQILDDALLGLGVDGILDSHVAAWRGLWASSIRTDSVSAAAPLQSSYYAILCAVRHDWPYSTAPGGLATDGYNGHSFWDEETWVMPNMMLLHPDIAYGSGFRYRFDRLAGAMVNARETLGVTGAAFPWESAFTGENVCPAPLFAHTEIHLTADVMLAIREYARLLAPAKRREFLLEAWPVLNHTSRFWVSRTTSENAYSHNTRVHLNNVTGPDEYHLGNDSVFTNYAVQSAVSFACDVATELNTTSDVADVWPYMRKIADDMTILYNATGNYHPEYDSYTGEAVKQADVILLNYPLLMPMNKSTARNDLDYYAKRTSPNKSGASTMTWSMFAVGYLSVRDFTAAWAYFLLGYVNNCFPPYWQWYQEMGGHAGNDNFITGAGGFLQSFWAGFLSMRVTDAGLRFSPGTMALPTDATFVALDGVKVHGAVVNLYLSAYPIAAPESHRLGALGATAGSFNVTLAQPSTDGDLCVNQDGRLLFKLATAGEFAAWSLSAFSGPTQYDNVTVGLCQA